MAAGGHPLQNQACCAWDAALDRKCEGARYLARAWEQVLSGDSRRVLLPCALTAGQDRSEYWGEEWTAWDYERCCVAAYPSGVGDPASCPFAGAVL